MSEVKEMVSASKVILLDIEGTTTSISFVKDTLYLYADLNFERFVVNNWDEVFMKVMVTELVCKQDALKNEDGFIALPNFNMQTDKSEEFRNKIIAHLKWQQSKDLKTYPLKYLQGKIWKKGYELGEIEGHIYEDVPEILKVWKDAKKKIFIFSSGSEEAQILLFKYSVFGDLDRLIDGNFDTSIGPKTEPESYSKIVQCFKKDGVRFEAAVKPEEIVFFTDRPMEVDAAKKIGIKVIRMERDEPNPYLEKEAEFIGKEDATLSSFSPLLEPQE